VSDIAPDLASLNNWKTADSLLIKGILAIFGL
jgi:hypothetical protein